MRSGLRMFLNETKDSITFPAAVGKPRPGRSNTLFALTDHVFTPARAERHFPGGLLRTDLRLSGGSRQKNLEKFYKKT